MQIPKRNQSARGLSIAPNPSRTRPNGKTADIVASEAENIAPVRATRPQKTNGVKAQSATRSASITVRLDHETKESLELLRFYLYQNGVRGETGGQPTITAVVVTAIKEMAEKHLASD